MAAPTTTRAAAFMVAGLLLAVLSAWTGQPSARITPERDPTFSRFSTDPRIPVEPDVQYGTAPDGSPLLVDVCLPPGDEAVATATDAAPRPALLLVHGGSWERGGKATIPYRAVCQWLARGTGFVVFNADYRLAPANPYPAAIDDLRAAITWIRSPRQVKRWDLDPRRIGAVGGSAGGNLVSLLATEGKGRLDRGTRVAAVVELSGPVDLTGRNLAPRLEPAQLAYLGCARLTPCATAGPASPTTWVDGTDPPFLVAHSRNEFIPLAQSVAFVKTLRRAGVRATLVEVAGTNHSISMLPGNPGLQTRILDFLRSELGTPRR